MPEITRAKTLQQGQLTRLIKITQATSRYPARDVLVLMLGHYCGMRITEISRLTVADLMHASGKLRSEISMREAMTKGCRRARTEVVLMIFDYFYSERVYDLLRIRAKNARWKN